MSVTMQEGNANVKIISENLERVVALKENRAKIAALKKMLAFSLGNAKQVKGI